jgi:hypothetical protein
MLSGSGAIPAPESPWQCVRVVSEDETKLCAEWLAAITGCRSWKTEGHKFFPDHVKFWVTKRRKSSEMIIVWRISTKKMKNEEK